LIKTDIRQAGIQESAGTPNKGTTLSIFISPWCFTNHHQPRCRIPATDHNMLALFR
jgi:hypothetical protein